MERNNVYGYILYATDPQTDEVATSESEVKSMWDRAAQALQSESFEHGTVDGVGFKKLDNKRYRGLIHYTVADDSRSWDLRKEISDKMPTLNGEVKPE